MIGILDMTIKYGGICRDSQFMCLLMQIQPFLSSILMWTNLLTNLFIKDLSPSSRNRIQTIFFQCSQSLGNSHLRFLSNKANFHSCKSLNMYIGSKLLYILKKLTVIMQIPMRMNSSHNMHFGNLITHFGNFIQHLFPRKLPSLFSFFLIIGTKFTTVNTTIGWFYMQILIKIGAITIFIFTYFIG